jgi:hypothetical protein
MQNNNLSAHSYSLDGALRESYIKAANSIQGVFERIVQPW